MQTEFTLDEDLIPLSPLEQEVFNQAAAALSLPLSAKLLWFGYVAECMSMANRSLGWNGQPDSIN